MAQPNLESFKVAGRRVFDSWTALTLAVEHGWGGRNSRAKKEEFFVNVMEMIAYENWSPNNPDDVREVADGLDDFLVDSFSTNCEDKSHEEIAKLLIDLCERAKKGDHSLAEHVMRTEAADWNKCGGRDETQFVDGDTHAPISMAEAATRDDIDDDSDDGMAEVGPVGAPVGPSNAPMFDEHGNFLGDGTQKPKKVKEAPPPPEIDADGFETVQTGRRRR